MGAGQLLTEGSGMGAGQLLTEGSGMGVGQLLLERGVREERYSR
jgi:hypothetical protein